MTIHEAYFLIALLQGIGYLQTSLTELVFFRKFSKAATYDIDAEIIGSRKLSWLLFGSNTPGLWYVLVSKIILGVLLIFFLYRGTIPFYLPLLMILFDQLGFFRFRLIGRSETSLQRVALVTLALHLFANNELVSQVGLAFISLQLFLAYFASGYQKRNDPKWKQGVAVLSFTERYLQGTWVWTHVTRYRSISHVVTYSVVLFEFLFFISVFNPQLAIMFFAFGIAFHLGISLTAGINEFFWVFVGSYPAVFYISCVVNSEISHLLFTY